MPLCSVFHKFSAFIRISEQMKDLDFFLQKQMQFQAERGKKSIPYPAKISS